MSSRKNKKPNASELIDKRCYPIGCILDRGLPGSFNEAMFYSIVDSVVQDLNKYGLCAIDNFIQRVSDAALPERIYAEVMGLHQSGKLCAGKVVQGNGGVQQHHNIRGDLITWLTGEEQGLQGVNCLIRLVDCVMMAATQHVEAGKLTDYQINLRTKAMAACYPGSKSHYVRHVDNPHGDGRVVTAIYYLNSQWQDKDGGQLVIYSQAMQGRPAVIKPQFDRLVFFWSDRRNPHEVLPAFATRYAVTLWYLDEHQRRSYTERRNQIEIERNQQQNELPAPPPRPATVSELNEVQQRSDAGSNVGEATVTGSQEVAMDDQRLLDELYQYLSEQSTDPTLLLDTGPQVTSPNGDANRGGCGDDSFLGDILVGEVEQGSEYLEAAVLSENSQRQPSPNPLVAPSAKFCSIPETEVIPQTPLDKFVYPFPTTAAQFDGLTQQFVEQCSPSSNVLLDFSSTCDLGSAYQQTDTLLRGAATADQITLGQQQHLQQQACAVHLVAETVTQMCLKHQLQQTPRRSDDVTLDRSVIPQNQFCQGQQPVGSVVLDAINSTGGLFPSFSEPWNNGGCQVSSNPTHLPTQGASQRKILRAKSSKGGKKS